MAQFDKKNVNNRGQFENKLYISLMAYFSFFLDLVQLYSIYKHEYYIYQLWYNYIFIRKKNLKHDKYLTIKQRVFD